MISERCVVNNSGLRKKLINKCVKSAVDLSNKSAAVRSLTVDYLFSSLIRS